VHGPAQITRALDTARLYGTTAARLMARGGRSMRLPTGKSCPRHILVVGSPRSGTTFLAEALGAVPGLIDLGEVKSVKAAIPELAQLPEEDAAARLRRALERVRRLGLVEHLRGVEQTPEMCFVLAAALRAFPEARVVHALRDGRDVVCSLLERGWLNASRHGRDDVLNPYGSHARFWVEPDRREEFVAASDAARAAWAWRCHVTAARTAMAAPMVGERTLELRYEALIADPAASAERLGQHLGLDPQPLTRALSNVHGRSVGRWRRELTPEQLAEVEREAGLLLRELGYDETAPFAEPLRAAGT
jgi:hypothetical protein